MTQVVTIGGQSVLFFEFPPNWKTPATTTHEYKTDIFTAYQGREQRRALRQTPRQSWEFKTSIYRDQQRAFDTIMSARLGRLFAVPDFTRSVATIFPTLNSTTRMAVADDGFDWLFVGALVAVQYGRFSELRTVQEVQGRELIFTTPTTRSWPINTKIRPVQVGRFDPNVPTRRLTSDVMEASIEFMVEPTTGYRVRGYQGRMFDNREVLTLRPNWGQPLTVNYETDWITLDFGRGARLVDHAVPYNSRLHKATYLGRTRQEADYIEGFFHRMRGRRGSFYTPTWIRDFNPEVRLLGGDSQMVISDLDVLRFLMEDPTRLRVVVVTKSGELFFNKITGAATPLGGWGNIWGLDWGGAGVLRSTVLGFRDPWPRDIELGEIASVSWLLSSRFASDSLTLEWETDTVTQFQLNIQTIEDRVPQLPPSVGGWGLVWGQAYGGAA
jgi:hypothetical protein